MRKEKSYREGFAREKLPESSILAETGIDLTYLAGRGELSPVHCREKELEKLVKILGRREAANPIIIGEPGVGKTALCRLLAIKIVANEVPGWVAESKILETSFERMYSTVKNLQSDVTEQMRNLRKVLEECRKMPIILFMDEIHTICSFPHSLKLIIPALADGSLRLIGATTLKEYRQYLEKNEPLVRRMTPVRIDEPCPETTAGIMDRLGPDLESHYGVGITPEILRLSVDLSENYIHNLYQPGKSIQVLEDSAINCCYQGRETVTRDDIMEAVSSRTGVPAEIMNGAGALLCGLEESLNKRVLGQEHVTRALSERIFLTRMNASLKPNRPRGVFLLAGPTGTGKTELAKALAFSLTGSEKNMVRFDMSIYRGAYAINSLLGIPHESGNGHESRLPPLTQALRDRPYTVLLLDEIEKAHPEIWKIFLSVFDEGRVSDLQGTEIFFDHATVIMTTNAGCSEKFTTVGFNGGEAVEDREKRRRRVVEVLEGIFPGEFMARIDEILVFEPLTPRVVREFIRRKIENLEEIAKKKIELSTGMVDFLAERGVDEKYGARFLEKTIEKHLSSEIARLKTGSDWNLLERIRFETDGLKTIVTTG